MILDSFFARWRYEHEKCAPSFLTSTLCIPCLRLVSRRACLWQCVCILIGGAPILAASKPPTDHNPVVVSWLLCLGVGMTCHYAVTRCRSTARGNRSWKKAEAVHQRDRLWHNTRCTMAFSGLKGWDALCLENGLKRSHQNHHDMILHASLVREFSCWSFFGPEKTRSDSQHMIGTLITKQQWGDHIEWDMKKHRMRHEKTAVQIYTELW